MKTDKKITHLIQLHKQWIEARRSNDLEEAELADLETKRIYATLSEQEKDIYWEYIYNH